MKIWGEVPKVGGVYNRKGAVDRVGKTDAVKGKTDQLSLSAGAKDFQTVMKALKDVPDVREEKVQDVSRKVEQGTYQVSSRDLAEKILRGMADRKV